MNNWHQSLTATVRVLPALLGSLFFPVAWAIDLQGVSSLEPHRTFFQSQPDSQAPIGSANTCQQVAAKGSGLYVREEPTVYSQALAILPDGQKVVVKNGGTEHWVTISAPLSGYVFRGFLAPCQSSPTTTEN